MNRALSIARTVRYAATRFGEIAYAAQGSGQPALFLHGAFFNGYFWRHIVDRIDDLRRCIAIDLLAHGATKTSRYQDVSFGAQADMIEAFHAALKLDCVDIVGHASGGAIAQIFAARYPQRIRSLTLTLFATPDAVRNLERWFIRWDDSSQTVMVEPLRFPAAAEWSSSRVRNYVFRKSDQKSSPLQYASIGRV